MNVSLMDGRGVSLRCLRYLLYFLGLCHPSHSDPVRVGLNTVHAVPM